MTDKLHFSQTLRAWMDAFMHRSMSGWNHFAKSTGLSMPQFSILMQLHHKGPCGMSEVSERFDISAAAASQLVDKLVQSGHLERAEDPNDRRAKNLRLTPSGAKLVDDGIQERYRWMEELAANLDAGDHAKISDALTLLTQAARKMDEKK